MAGGARRLLCVLCCRVWEGGLCAALGAPRVVVRVYLDRRGLCRRLEGRCAVRLRGVVASDRPQTVCRLSCLGRPPRQGERGERKGATRAPCPFLFKLVVVAAGRRGGRRPSQVAEQLFLLCEI